MGDKMSNKAQMQISFGMIFSIILIIAFLGFAFYAIKTFLGVQDSAKIATFRNSLQDDVDKIWKGTMSSQQVSYSLPSKIKQVCFKKNQDVNMFFAPENSVNLEPVNINHLDINKITGSGNSFCVDNKNGKVSMTLEKKYGEDLVTITGA